MKKILIVDDEQDLCMLAKLCLEKTGEYQVMTTSLPEEVLQLCLQEKPDLILLDNVMPNMQGTEIIQALRDNPETAKTLIVVTSGGGEMVYFKKKDEWKWQPNRSIVRKRGEIIQEKGAERAAQAYGVDDFIAKPFSPQTLVEVVQEVFERTNPQEDESEF